MPISQSNLREKSLEFQETIYEKIQRLALASQKKSAFLCHSHKDQELVKGLLVILQNEGVDLYIDWNDNTMPDVPNTVTAKKIQEKIRKSDLFLFLATANSKASRWCPWEIGYADSGNKNIYIIPTSDSTDTYGNEYLGLYPKIDQASIDPRKGLNVFKVTGETERFSTHTF